MWGYHSLSTNKSSVVLNQEKKKQKFLIFRPIITDVNLTQENKLLPSL